MKKIQVGRAGLEVSRIGLGCVTFGREIDERQACAVLDYAMERGINLFDTAEAYGQSEAILGRWLKSNGLRDQVVLQTKVLRPARLREALATSLERLQTDRVDLYLFHRYDSETPLEQSLAAMAEAVDGGTVHVAGCSNFNAAQLAEAERLAPGLLQTIQPIYNLVRREIEAELLPLCARLGVTAISYSPLGAGFLAGKYRPDAPFPPGTRFDRVPGHTNEYFSERNFAIVEKLRALAEETGLSMVRLAMGWALAQPQMGGVLIGARHPGHIDNALAEPLPPELLSRLDALSA